VPVLAAIKRRQACSELEVVGAKGEAMAETPCGPLGDPEDTGGLLDGVEVLLHRGILPLPEAFAPLRSILAAVLCGHAPFARPGFAPVFGCRSISLVSLVPYVDGHARSKAASVPPLAFHERLALTLASRSSTLPFSSWERETSLPPS
jgi:hypothetical protein